MKAKEYAAQYEADGKTPKALYRVWMMLFYEFKELIEKRHAESNSSAVAIFNELNLKWQAFARIVNDGIRPDGFIEMTKHKMPELYAEMKPFISDPHA
jgi:hypothetical protein